MLRRSSLPSVKLFRKRAQKKKALFTLVLIQSCIVLHEILHLSWFSTKHYFSLIGILIAFQFINFYAFIYIVTTHPGIIQKIVALKIFRIKSMKSIVNISPYLKMSISQAIFKYLTF